ncbi:hypothetical protein E2C01_048833 [Portunus trituberculatus]|uniref:Uncharacterized protein n=1 Tax=Portunus trituberculatus TaxID=210409 RepID=A0A5B7GEF3_PORTR|nr:hypothetical protein [Portunus trituberculatus]
MVVVVVVAAVAAEHRRHGGASGRGIIFGITNAATSPRRTAPHRHAFPIYLWTKFLNTFAPHQDYIHKDILRFK